MANDKSVNMPNLDLEDKLAARSPLFTTGSTSGNKSIREVSDDLEECFGSVEEKVMIWESSRTRIWDSGDVAVTEYLQAISEAQRIGEILRNFHAENEAGVNKADELLDRVQIVIRISMVKLEEEFSHIIVRRNRPFEPECMSFHSSDVGTMDGISISSFELDQNLIGESSSRYSSSTYSGKHTIDLVHQYTNPDLNQIVTAMFTNHFDMECCDAYINARKNALAECLFMLEVDNLSIDVREAGTEISKIKEGKRDASFIIKIKKWNRAMKITTDYLAREKQLCDRVFGEFKSVAPTCLAKIFEVSMIELLKYGEAIMDFDGQEPEKLFLKLDMYEVLRDLLPDIDNMFLEEEAGSSVRYVFRELLKRSGDSVRETVVKFEKAIGSDPSTKPFTGGGTHDISKYVMKYIAILASDYSDTLGLLFGVPHGGDTLEENEKEDDALRCIFLMNNIFYMVSKVKKNSNLRQFFGDYWIR
ncbi:exocyst complex component EXO70E2-like [Papaver somniferum]|uniref:exocyst complex component EXO70E2-like n=1 Tax=Papaver somniferum TaxID=3469 RepID=UPI000E6F8976|nr:exocyst complex component EXO70E2-like [Papaver somniferum]